MLVRTGGRYRGARGGGDRSWLLIKHRDDWAGDVDIAEFAPLQREERRRLRGHPRRGHTRRSGTSNRPAKGGDTGAMFAKIIERAASIEGRARSATQRHKGHKKKASARNADVEDESRRRRETAEDK